MSLDLTKVIESAADEVAQAGRAAAGTINELVHDWGHETRSFVSDHAPALPSLPGHSRHRRRGMSMVRLLIPVAIVAVIAFVLMRRRGTPSYLPESERESDRSRDDTARFAEGAAAS